MSSRQRTDKTILRNILGPAWTEVVWSTNTHYIVECTRTEEIDWKRALAEYEFLIHDLIEEFGNKIKDIVKKDVDGSHFEIKLIK